MSESGPKNPSSQSGSDDATYVPTAGFGDVGTGGLGVASSSSTPSQDLSGDKLLLSAPRVSVEQKSVPALGGIPLLAKLGQGGMGAVYFGIHPRLHLDVAVKVLPFNLAEQNPDLIQRFFREARIAASIQSPHLVGVKDVNEDSGLFYLVMEFVRGLSAGDYLRELLKAGRPGLSETTALDICIAATKGLCAAHEKGVIHRDIKPDNIMLPFLEGTTEPQFIAAKLADLGLARSEGMDKSLTGSQSAMGTPGYMAPEQGMDAKAAGKPADVFSMGAMLYALLSGNAPFVGSSLMKVLLDTANTPHQPVRIVRPDVSQVTEELLTRSLSKDPAQRYADAHALLKALQVCREAQGEPDATMQAIEQLTMLQQAAEVGAPVQQAGAPSPKGSSAFRPPAAQVPPSSLPGQTPAMPAPTPPPPQPASAPPSHVSQGKSILPWAVTALVLVTAAVGYIIQSTQQTTEPPQPVAQPAAESQATEQTKEVAQVPEPPSEPAAITTPETPAEPVPEPTPKPASTPEELERQRMDALQTQAKVEAKREQLQRVETDLNAALRMAPGDMALKRLHEACKQNAFGGKARLEADAAFNFGKSMLNEKSYSVAIEKFKDAEAVYVTGLAFKNAAEKVLQSEVAQRTTLETAMKECVEDEQALYAPVTSLLDQAQKTVASGMISKAETELTSAGKKLAQAEVALAKRRLAAAARDIVSELAALPTFKADLHKAGEMLKKGDKAGADGSYEQAGLAYANAQQAFDGVLSSAKQKVGTLRTLVNNQHAQKQYEGALKSLEMIFKINPKDEAATAVKAAIERDQKYDQTMAAGQAHRTEAERLLSLVAKGAASAKDCEARFAAAAQAFNLALTVKPKDAEAQTASRLAQAGINEARYQGALGEARGILATERADAQGYYGDISDEKRIRVEAALNRALAAKNQDSVVNNLKEKLELNLTNPLKFAREGDWIELKVITKVAGMNDLHGTMKYTVSDIDGDTVSLKAYTNINNHKTEGKEKHDASKKLGDSLENFSANLPPGTQIKLTRSGKETVFINGKIHRCIWQEFNAAFPEDNDEGFVRATMKIWLSASVPVIGLVKMEMLTVVYNGEGYINAYTTALYSKTGKR